MARTCSALYILTSKCASRHNGVHFFDISTSKSGPRMVCFVHFQCEICFAPQRRALFRHLNFQKWSENGVRCTCSLRNVLRATTACTFCTSQLPKVVREWCVLYIFTSKCASRHNGVHFFVTEPPKWLEHVVLCTFSLRNVLRPTMACTFSTSQLPKVAREWCVLYIFNAKCASRHNGVHVFISHLPRCLRTRRFSEPTFQPSGATKPLKNTVFRDFPTCSRTCIFFLLIFSLLTLLPADCLFISPYCRKFDFQTSFDNFFNRPPHATYYSFFRKHHPLFGFILSLLISIDTCAYVLLSWYALRGEALSPPPCTPPPAFIF